MIPDWLTTLASRALATDGQPPFSDQSLVDLAAGDRELVADEPVGAAIVQPGEEGEFELVIDPDARGAGRGTALLERVLARANAPRFAWAHGDHPASRVLADRFGFRPVRTLEQHRKALSGLPRDASAEARLGPRTLRSPSVGGHDSPDVSIRPFRPGVDDAAWLDVNARAFAEHPEQGALAQRDLDARLRAEWFDADDFLLAWDGDTLLGSNWLKVDGEVGEIYAIGVAPEHQGRGLSRALMEAGLARLVDRGIRTVALYVEADNAPALALYERYGFTRHTVDVRYARG